MTVTVESARTVSALSASVGHLDRSIGSALDRAAEHLKNVIQTDLGSKQYPPASMVGQSPARRTGFLQNSIEAYTGSSGFERYARISATAGYAAALEPPAPLNRPFMWSNFDREKTLLEGFIVDAVRSVM